MLLMEVRSAGVVATGGKASDNGVNSGDGLAFSPKWLRQHLARDFGAKRLVRISEISARADAALGSRPKFSNFDRIIQTTHVAHSPSVPAPSQYLTSPSPFVLASATAETVFRPWFLPAWLICSALESQAVSSMMGGGEEALRWKAWNRSRRLERRHQCERR